MGTPKTPSTCARHTRDPSSFHVNYTAQQVQTLAKEILDDTIADVSLSLFTYWIQEKPEHYEEAKKYIRQLGLDQGYATARVENEALRKLLEATSQFRPRASPAIDPKVKEVLRRRQTSSPLRSHSILMPRTSSLPGIESKDISNSDNASRSTLSSDREYPPNTPDRPAPLSVRIKEHGSASDTAMLRSVSTPIPHQQVPFGESSVTGWDLTAGQASASEQRYSQSTTETDVEGQRDIFESLSHEAARRNRLFNEDHRSPVLDDSSIGPFVLEPHELAQSESNSPLAERQYLGSPPTGTSVNDPYNSDDEYAATSNGSGQVLPQNFSGSEHPRSRDGDPYRLEIQYARQYAQEQRSRQAKQKPIPAPTPARRRAAAEARREARLVSSGPASGFHRPLPLRSYESVALYPTARTGVSASHNRTASVGETPTRTRYPMPIGDLTGTTGLPGRRRDLRNNSSQAEAEAEGGVDASPSSPTPSQSTSLRSDASTSILDLSRFPAVPETISAPSPGSLALIYRSVTEAYMMQALQRTRARGAQLPTVHWSSLSPFERTWREVNEQLLISIYGRKNISLTDSDVSFVDRIARELRDGVGRISGYEWVGELFERAEA